MNKIKIGEIVMGYSNEVKKYALLSEVIKFAESIRADLIIKNNIPNDNNENYMKYLNKNNLKVGYMYHGKDTHEYALLKIKNGKIKLVDRVFAVINFTYDEDILHVVFQCKGDEKYTKYSSVRKSLQINLNNNEKSDFFNPMDMLNSIIRKNK